MSASLRKSELLLILLAVFVVVVVVRHWHDADERDVASERISHGTISPLPPTEQALTEIRGVNSAIQYSRDGVSTVIVVIDNVEQITSEERDALVTGIRNVLAADLSVRRAVLFDSRGGQRLDWLNDGAAPSGSPPSRQAGETAQ